MLQRNVSCKKRERKKTPQRKHTRWAKLIFKLLTYHSTFRQSDLQMILYTSHSPTIRIDKCDLVRKYFVFFYDKLWNLCFYHPSCTSVIWCVLGVMFQVLLIRNAMNESIGTFCVVDALKFRSNSRLEIGIRVDRKNEAINILCHHFHWNQLQKHIVRIMCVSTDRRIGNAFPFISHFGMTLQWIYQTHIWNVPSV